MKSKDKILVLTGVVGGLYGINKYIFLQAVKDQKMNHQGLVYRGQFGNIFYTVHGTGSPVLMLHHLESGASGYEWQRMNAELMKTHTVYTIDLPGYGRSAKTNMVFTNFIYVKAMTDFVKNVIQEQTYIVSSYDASEVAVMSAYSEPKLFKKLIMINPVSMEKKQLKSYWKKAFRWLMEMPICGSLLYNMCHTKKDICNQFQKKYYYDSNLINSEDVECFYESAHIGGFSSRYPFISRIAQYTDVGCAHALEKLNVPIVILSGTAVKDNKKIAEEYVWRNKDVIVDYIRYTKILPQMEKPLTTARKCLKYMKDN